MIFRINLRQTQITHVTFPAMNFSWDEQCESISRNNKEKEELFQERNWYLCKDGYSTQVSLIFLGSPITCVLRNTHNHNAAVISQSPPPPSTFWIPFLLYSVLDGNNTIIQYFPFNFFFSQWPKLSESIDVTFQKPIYYSMKWTIVMNLYACPPHMPFFLNQPSLLVLHYSVILRKRVGAHRHITQSLDGTKPKGKFSWVKQMC